MIRFLYLHLSYRLLLGFIFGASITLDLAASQLYRYKTASGETVLSRTIPPELVGNGYEVLNEKGRVIQNVAPALTPEQIVERDAALERQRELEQERALQSKKDAELKQLYSHPDDAVRIMERKGNDILNVIQARLGKIEFARKNIVELEQQAAALQRKGRAVPRRFEDQVTALKKDIDNAKADIVERDINFDELLDEFSGIVSRLELILNKKSIRYQSVREKLIQIKQNVKIDN